MREDNTQKAVESEIISEQNEYAKKLCALNALRFNGRTPKAYIHTYGCQQNNADSEKIKGMLCLMGYALTEDKTDADIIIFNTCAVRENAENRVFGNVGILKKLKEEKPHLLIVLCGCMVQQEHIAEKIKKSYPYVGLIFGTHVIHRFPKLVYDTICKKKRTLDISADTEEIIEGIEVKRDGSCKAFLPIMYGCNNFCTYCVVPLVRGREKSRKSSIIINEFKELVAQGYKDITLLGQNVNSYGKEPHDINFPELLRELNQIEGDFLIRFMTSHPKDASKELIDTIAQCEKVCKHLHLPLQSGNNRVLKEMNRKYTKEDYQSIVSYAKETIPGLSLSSDIIVGFPGESYEEFLDTLTFIKKNEFSNLFTFIYSKRSGTKAAEMADPVSESEKSRRFTMLLETQEEISLKKAAECQGKVYKVLIEGQNEDGLLYGRTQQNISIAAQGGENLIASFVNIKVTGGTIYKLTGEIIS